MANRCNFAVVALVGIAAFAPAAFAQNSVSDRIRQIRMQRDIDAEIAAQRTGLSARQALRQNIQTVSLDNIGVRNALTWLQNVTGLTVVVNWRAMEDAGITADQPVTIVGAEMTAEAALNQIIRQISPDQPLVWELTPWYVELLTKEQANQRSVVLVYPIGDLLQTVPNFTDAPSFDLSQVTQGSSGGGGGGGGSLFGDAGQSSAPTISRQEHAEQIAQLIRDTIEPEIWKENGGTAGSVTFYRDSLVIRAPMYVHRQIGGYAPLGRAVGPGGPMGAGPVSAGPGIGFDPQIGVVQGGNVMDVVGSTTDGRYVTISGGFSNATVNSIRSVPVQGAVGGVVGASVTSDGTAGVAPNFAAPARRGTGWRDAGIGR